MIRTPFLAVIVGAAVGCSSSSSSATASPDASTPLADASAPPADGSFDASAPLSDATSLACPTPGLLPFRLQSQGFQNPDNAGADDDGGFIKDQAGDTLGNPGGSSANVYLDPDAGPAPGIASFQGVKARSPVNNGLETTALPGEFVSLWYFDPTALRWTTLGRTTTDAQGSYTIPATLAPPLGTPVYSLLEADGTCATHYDTLLPAGSKVVVADMDGTLTTDNDQILDEVNNEAYVPAMMKDANVLMQTWAGKKYPVVYLTARAHILRAESRLWLDGQHFPVGILITSPILILGSAESYKASWLAHMVNDFGWNVVAAYGNEDTDIQAYQSAGIPNDQIFIVGPSGGDLGSVAIPGNDFTSHVAAYVEAQPDND